MEVRKLDGDFWVAAQIDPSRMNALAAAGIRSIVSNRPDGEEAGQPAFSEVERAANEAGIAIAHVPVVSGKITESDVRAFRELLDRLPAPTLGFCKSGKRAATMWAMARDDGRPVEALLDAAPVATV